MSYNFSLYFGNGGGKVLPESENKRFFYSTADVQSIKEQLSYRN